MNPSNSTRFRPAPKFSNPGRLRRYSYIDADQNGHAVRRWHVKDDGTATEGSQVIDPAIARSLRGMVRP